MAFSGMGSSVSHCTRSKKSNQEQDQEARDEEQPLWDAFTVFKTAWGPDHHLLRESVAEIDNQLIGRVWRE
jgi:hypothetical protein